MKMFDWFRRKSHHNKGDRIEDSSDTDRQNGTHGGGGGGGGGEEGKVNLIDILDDFPCGLLAIGTFGLFNHIPESKDKHHFPDLVDDMDDAEAVCDTNPNSTDKPIGRDVTVIVNGNVNVHSLHNGIGATYVMASVKPRIPLENVFSMSDIHRNKPTAAKNSCTHLAFMKKFVEKSRKRSDQEVGSGCNREKVIRGGLFERKIRRRPVDVGSSSSASEIESKDAGRAQGKGTKSKTWRNKCKNTLSCFTGCIIPASLENGHTGAELQPQNTNLGGDKEYTWVKTDGEYVVLEF